MNHNTTRLAARLLGIAALLFAGAIVPTVARAHDTPAHYSAGEPGDPKKPARTVKVAMIEKGKEMLFEPSIIQVRKGEQIRFVLDNEGTENHEFVVATRTENRKHAEEMKRYPDMEHDDPNAKRILPFMNGELVWKFTKSGEFEYACLIPGHLAAGMLGKIIVK
jgi:uncharacterized cupredoxin-like copper-binding protein